MVLGLSIGKDNIMRNNIPWDVCPDWVRFKKRDNNERPESSGCSPDCNDNDYQRHVHEFLGSTKLAESGAGRHNHRFAGVTGEAIPTLGSHKHKINTKTDYFDHFHELKDVFTGPAINVGNGKHVHFVKGETTFDDGHDHDFQFATLIESPLLPKDRC